MKRFKTLNIRTFTLLFLIIISVTSCIGPGVNTNVVNKTFPSVTGIDLLGKIVNVPNIFQGTKILVAVGFKRKHQKEIKNWASYINQIIKTNDSIKFYILPVLHKTNFFHRMWINNIMKFSTTMQERPRTITVYTDQKKFAKYLNMDTTQAYLVVLDEKQNILKIIKGNPDSYKLKELNKILS